MKKLLKLSFALLSMAFIATSCGSDDDAPAVSLENLQKRWYPVSTKYPGSNVPYDGHQSCGKDYTEFQANSAMRKVDVTDCQTDPTILTGTYTVTDNTLTTAVGGATSVYTLKTLNANNMELAVTLNGAEIVYVYTSNP